MMTILIKKRYKIQFLYLIVLLVLLMLSNCNVLGDGSFGSEDSGFQILIENYSNEEYRNYTFYMGYKNSTNNFVATDSITYNDVIIYKKGDGNLYDQEGGFSLSRPFSVSTNGLNKYGYWEPDIETIQQFSKDGSAYFKVNLEGNISVSSARAAFNGTVLLKILENGDLVW